LPSIVSNSGPLYLQYVGAQIPEELRCHRTGEDAAKVEDTDAEKRSWLF
jgi:hypothetical protein